MTANVRLAQLYILRSQVDVLIAMEEGVVQTDGPLPCEHPEDKRRDTSNMGEERTFYCMACGQTLQGVA